MKVCLIAAVAENGAIGNNNQLIWHIPEDLKLFKRLTSGHHLLLGRKTFESIGRPLPNRISLVVSSGFAIEHPSVQVVPDIRSGIDAALANGETTLFVAGGATIYDACLAQDLVDEMYITHVHKAFEADTFFPAIDLSEWKANVVDEGLSDKEGLRFKVTHYTKS